MSWKLSKTPCETSSLLHASRAVYFNLVLVCLLIGLKSLIPLSQPIRSKTKPIVTCTHAFSRTLHIFASSFDWFTGLSVSFVIGQSNYFGFGYTTLIWKLLYMNKYQHGLWAALFFRSPSSVKWKKKMTAQKFALRLLSPRPQFLRCHFFF